MKLQSSLLEPSPDRFTLGPARQNTIKAPPAVKAQFLTVEPSLEGVFTLGCLCIVITQFKTQQVKPKLPKEVPAQDSVLCLAVRILALLKHGTALHFHAKVFAGRRI